MGNGSLRQVEHRVDVRPESQLPFLVADIANVREARLVCSIVDKDIDPAKLRDGAIDDFLAMRRVLDITWHQDRLAPSLLDPGLGLLGIFVFVQIGDQHIGAFARIGDGNGPADPAIATDNDCLLAGKAP